jgi:hypothetical protein
VAEYGASEGGDKPRPYYPLKSYSTFVPFTFDFSYHWILPMRFISLVSIVSIDEFSQASSVISGRYAIDWRIDDRLAYGAWMRLVGR